MPQGEVTVRLKAPNGTWETCGVDRVPGVVPESVRLTANDWGSESASLLLRRHPNDIYPDLSAWTPCEVAIAGQDVWAGDIKETPTRDGDDFGINVIGQGDQFRLDDDSFERSWAHAKLTDLQDARSFPSTNLANYTTGWEVGAGDGAIRMALPAGATAAAGKACSVILDTGDTVGVKRVVLTYLYGGKAGLSLYVANAATSPTAEDELILFDGTPMANTTNVGQSFTTPRRYLELLLSNQSGATMTGDETSWVLLTGVQVFRDTAYESGGASILKPSDVVKDSLTACYTGLSTDTSLIQASTFSLPEFTTQLDGMSPREVMQAVNAVEGWVTKVGLDKRVIYKPRPTAPLWEIGNWSGAEFEDASAGSGQEIYNKAYVTGTGPDGQRVRSTRTQTGTVLDRFNRTRSRRLPINVAINSAIGDRLADVYLGLHKTTPFKGSFKAVQGGVREVLTGASPHPAHLLRQTTELVRMSHMIDPDTGGIGRDGTIAHVEYVHDDRAAKVTIDNQRDKFETLLSRYGMLVG